MGRTRTEVALAWVMQRPAVSSVLVGATRPDQLELNLRAIDVPLPADVISRLNDVSAPEANELDHFFEPVMQNMIHGGVRVSRGLTGDAPAW